MMQPNSLAFIALCNEFCGALEETSNGLIPDRMDFVARILNYLPRIYISATDLKVLPEEDLIDNDSDAFSFGFASDLSIDNVLDEDYYDAIRRSLEQVMGEDDIYLEVFEEDMKYSDTPVSASVAEGLADLFQVLYNFVETIKDAPSSRVSSALSAVKEDFEHYWSRIVCNLMRALNAVRYPDAR
ncbi:MAG: DUF5063 domain-containing protein [Paramuribaculum sp.]|nr:DUF5063 domain-containing protein [Paramuribaculum sp.]